MSMENKLIALVVSILVATVIAVQVVIPVLTEAIAKSGVDGPAATVLGLLPLFVGVMLLLGISGPLTRM